MSGEAKTRNLVLVVGAARDFPLRSVSYVRWFSVPSAVLWIPIGFLLVTWRVESSPLCRRVMDTSGHHCGDPVSLLFFINFRRCGLLPNVFLMCPIAISSHCFVHNCSLFWSLSFAAIRHCFSSSFFVPADLDPVPALDPGIL
jgi:hypothetical protein